MSEFQPPKGWLDRQLRDVEIESTVRNWVEDLSKKDKAKLYKKIRNRKATKFVRS